MREKTDAELYQDMLDDLGLDEVSEGHVPDFIQLMLERLVDAGWRKP